jgi:hypothetical protein
MKYNLVSAAEAIGVSKATMHRYVRRGRISATRTEDGFYEIDPAELHRVFPPVSKNEPETVSRDEVKPPKTNGETEQYASVLEAQLEGLKALIAEKDRRIIDLETDRDRWAEQAQRLALAPPQAVTAQQARRGCWPWRKSA